MKEEGEEIWKLKAFLDAYWSGFTKDRKSVSDPVVFFKGSAVSWISIALLQLQLNTCQLKTWYI